jgi:RNA polymerase sigma-70 factor (ECF subfamily)
MPPPAPTIDDDVLAAAKRGDRAAHARLYEVFGAPVYTLARRMLRSRAHAEDVLQETFVEVLRNVAAYRGDAALGTWIKRIAVNKCLAYLRSGWKLKRDEDFDIDASPSVGAAAQFDDAIALERALDTLADVPRAVVWLHDVEGYTHGEIGRLMGRTPSFSKSQLARAHERLREALGDDKAEQRAKTSEPSETRVCTHALKTC